jgi:hypothetical protein
MYILWPFGMYILWPFGMYILWPFYGYIFDKFSPFWYVVPRQIWHPCCQ